MSQVSLKEGKAGISGLVDQVAKGDFLTITRHGKPVAALVSIEAAEAARKALGKARPNFGEYLMQFPGGVEFERNASKMRDIEF